MGVSSFPYDSISRMRAWDFWARPSSLDLTDDDRSLIEAVGPDGAAPETRERVYTSVRRAAFALRNADIGVPCGKPS